MDDQKTSLIQNRSGSLDKAEELNVSIDKPMSRLHPTQINEENIKVDQEIINKFTMYTIIMFFAFYCLTLIPQILILYNVEKVKALDIFKETWWIGLAVFIITFLISLYAYFDKHRLFSHGNFLIYFIFPFYIATALTLFIILSFFNVWLLFAISILILTNLITAFCLNLIRPLQNKPWIKLFILFTITFTFLIFYIGLINQHFVEYFVVAVITMYLMSYLEAELKFLLIEYFFDHEVTHHEITFRIMLVTFTLLNVDILVCCFKR
jgi:hypothetical protein